MLHCELMSSAVTIVPFCFRGDVVICKNSRSPKEFVCKRVVAMEGDKVFNTETNTFCHVSCLVENAFYHRKGHLLPYIYIYVVLKRKMFNIETDTF